LAFAEAAKQVPANSDRPKEGGGHTGAACTAALRRGARGRMRGREAQGLESRCIPDARLQFMNEPLLMLIRTENAQVNGGMPDITCKLGYRRVSCDDGTPYLPAALNRKIATDVHDQQPMISKTPQPPIIRHTRANSWEPRDTATVNDSL